MIGRVVDIASDGRHISKHRGFLLVEERGQEVGRVALDEIAAVIAHAHGLTYSNNLLTELAERSIPFVICGPHHRPVAFLWSVEGHHVQSGRMNAQAEASKPLKKRLWQQIVRAKIEQQGAALETVGAPAGGFQLLVRKVRSGDPENVEAQAARRYWRLLFGDAFRRDSDGGGVNALLNYGYAVLRAGCARALMAAGLHPSLGLAHANRLNPFCLVDDCMEPFRPVVDLLVFELCQEFGPEAEISPETKKALARILVLDMATRQGATPVLTCLERLSLSLARCYEGDADKLELPERPLPLEVAR